MNLISLASLFQILFFVSFVVAESNLAEPRESSSSQMKNFKISQCHNVNKTKKEKNEIEKEVCFEAKGDLAFFSMNQKNLSAVHVKLSVFEKLNDRIKNHHDYDCSSFRYDLISSFLICDERAFN